MLVWLWLNFHGVTWWKLVLSSGNRQHMHPFLLTKGYLPVSCISLNAYWLSCLADFLCSIHCLPCVGNIICLNFNEMYFWRHKCEHTNIWIESKFELGPRLTYLHLGDYNSSPQMLHICVSELGHHWIRQSLVAYSALSHHLNQCWLVVNSAKFESKFYLFNLRKCIWKCRLPKWRPFCLGGDELIIPSILVHLYRSGNSIIVVVSVSIWLSSCWWLLSYK